MRYGYTWLQEVSSDENRRGCFCGYADWPDHLANHKDDQRATMTRVKKLLCRWFGHRWGRPAFFVHEEHGEYWQHAICERCGYEPPPLKLSP
jgi:hypothetical protein